MSNFIWRAPIWGHMAVTCWLRELYTLIYYVIFNIHVDKKMQCNIFRLHHLIYYIHTVLYFFDPLNVLF